jgi:hypothetical protein
MPRLRETAQQSILAATTTGSLTKPKLISETN